MDRGDIFKLMSERQRKNAGEQYRLTENDLRRISKYIINDIFTTKHQCIIWDGYINQKGHKTQYAKISFRGKKVLLHRLLYHNFIADVCENDEILYTCKNRGKCCTLAHLQLRSKTIKEEQPKPKKLTNEDIRKIYNDKDNYSRKDLAKKHGVSLTTVRNIILGNIYTGITNSEGPSPCTIKNAEITVSFD